uniref:Uncharacterized protein n=1 Tax=Eutreptiella gymnastica TaxID=73025 RepID=A0A7S4D1H2_9EUGL
MADPQPSRYTQEQKEEIRRQYQAMKAQQVAAASTAKTSSGKADEEGMLKAAEAGDTAALKRFLEAEQDVNVAGGRQLWTALHRACARGRLEAAELLLQQPHVDVNVQDRDGWTPLHYACHYKRDSIVQALLRHPDIGVNVRSGNELTPLHCACNTGHVDTVQALLAHGDVDVNARDAPAWSPLSCGRRTPLHNACFKGQTAVVRLLLGNPDIDLSIPDAEGCTAKDVAEARTRSEILQLLEAR